MSTTAILDPDRITFLDDETFVSAGSMILACTYPSESMPEHRYSLVVRGDGTRIAAGNHDDTCPGFRRYGGCLHTHGTAELVREYWRRHFRALPVADLLREDNFLAHCRADSLDSAQRLQWDAVGDVVAERCLRRLGLVARGGTDAA